MKRVRVVERVERVRIKEKVERVRVKDGGIWTPDYIARTIIVQAYLYYVLDAPTMSDGEWDKRAKYVADNWDELHPDRKWALGSPDAIRATGHHIKFSSHAAGAALNHHKYATGEVLEIWDDEWRFRKRDGCQFVTTTHQPIPVDEYIRRKLNGRKR